MEMSSKACQNILETAIGSLLRFIKRYSGEGLSNTTLGGGGGIGRLSKVYEKLFFPMP